MGQKGEIGGKGVTGASGADGPSGSKGDKGSLGTKGAKGVSGSTQAGFVIVVHSQTATTPSCTNGSLIYSGYSLLQTTGNGEGAVQDLGRPGSCLQRFSFIPFTQCKTTLSCQVAAHEGVSYWLASREINSLSSVAPIRGDAVRDLIGRCSVCRVLSPGIAVHSFSNSTPSCPTGWYSAYSGYSLLAVSYILTRSTVDSLV